MHPSVYCHITYNSEDMEDVHWSWMGKEDGMWNISQS